MYKQYNVHICKFRQNIVVFSWLYFPPPNSLQLGDSFGKLLHHQRTAGAQALINHIGSIRICNATLKRNRWQRVWNSEILTLPGSSRINFTYIHLYSPNKNLEILSRLDMDKWIHSFFPHGPKKGFRNGRAAPTTGTYRRTTTQSHSETALLRDNLKLWMSVALKETAAVISVFLEL